MKTKPSGPQRAAYILAIMLPVLFTGLALLSWVLGIQIADPVLDGLRVEAIGAVLTAGYVLLLSSAFQGFFDTEAQQKPPDETTMKPSVEAELAAIRQELRELKQLLMDQHP